LERLPKTKKEEGGKGLTSKITGGGEGNKKREEIPRHMNKNAERGEGLSRKATEGSSLMRPAVRKKKAQGSQKVGRKEGNGG